MELALVSALSVLLQVSAAVLALRLIRVSGRRTAWILISLAILLMVVRRGFTLFRLLAGEPPHPLDFPFEVIGLLVSAFMFVGILYIAPIFRAIQAAAEERESMVASLQEALANVKTLSALLPICASCKKIRDDQGYWTQIEKYIFEHTDTRFSHGICPDCSEKIYGEIAREP